MTAPDDDPVFFEDIYDPDTLAALDAPVEARDEVPLPSRLSSWSRSTTMGMVLSGYALGLQEVLDPKEERPIVIEVDADGEPHGLPIELLLDPDDPRGSVCIIHRDWARPPEV